MMVSESDARDAALHLWIAWNRRSEITTGLMVNPDAMRTALSACADLTLLPESRLSPTGKPMDFVAPSAWHAACHLLAAAIQSRVSRIPFDDDSIFEQFFGHRAVFRGQARSWHIQPTAWRHSFDTGRALMAVEEYINTLTTDEDAIEFELFGRLRSVQDAAALAQHYGIPTNLVDFTFDPMVAIFFALGESGAEATDVPGPVDHAVVFTAPVHKLAALGGIHFSFPPVQAQRLFRQSGLFIDFGNKPVTTNHPYSFEERWTWFEQNCARVFFPRLYPVEPSLTLFNADYFLSPEAFFADVVAAAKAYAEDVEIPDCVAFVRQNVKTRPPWRVASDGGGIYTDDEILTIGQLVERYLVSASLVQTGDGPCYDPIILALIAQTDDRVLRAVTDLAELRGTSLVALVPAAEQIRRAFLRLKAALASTTHPDW